MLKWGLGFKVEPPLIGGQEIRSHQSKTFIHFAELIGSSPTQKINANYQK